jgi:hypothetical protein
LADIASIVTALTAVVAYGSYRLTNLAADEVVRVDIGKKKNLNDDSLKLD